MAGNKICYQPVKRNQSVTDDCYTGPKANWCTQNPKNRKENQSILVQIV